MGGKPKSKGNTSKVKSNKSKSKEKDKKSSKDVKKNADKSKDKSKSKSKEKSKKEENIKPPEENELIFMLATNGDFYQFDYMRYYSKKFKDDINTNVEYSDNIPGYLKIIDEISKVKRIKRKKMAMKMNMNRK